MVTMYMPDYESLIIAMKAHDALETIGVSQLTYHNFLNNLPPMKLKISTRSLMGATHYFKWDYNRIELKRFDMSTGKMVDDKPIVDISMDKRARLRKKRKRKK